VKHSTGEESTKACGTIAGPVIEINNSPPLVKRRLFTTGDVENSSSPNESAPWVQPLLGMHRIANLPDTGYRIEPDGMNYTAAGYRIPDNSRPKKKLKKLLKK